MMRRILFSGGGGFNTITGFTTTERQDDAKRLGLVCQDDFKLRRKSDHQLGLAGSYLGHSSPKQGNSSKPIPGTGGANFLTGLVVRSAGHSWDAEKNNFGPQIALAWSRLASRTSSWCAVVRN